MTEMKQRLQDYADSFTSESCNFQKCVILHDYMETAHKDKILFGVIENTINELPLELSIACNCEQVAFESEWFETDLDIISNDRIYFLFLQKIYQAMKYYKHAPDNRKSELRKNK